MSIYITEANITEFKLIDNSPYAEARQEWWKNITDYMGDQFMFTMQFGPKMVDIGGYFTRTGYIKLDKICVPETCADIDIPVDNDDFAIGPGTVKFKSENEFAIMLHEVSHYMHFVKDNGEYTAPSLKDLKFAKIDPLYGFGGLNRIIDLEYEAGYRSIKTAEEYGLFGENDRTVLINNLTNMSHYLTFNNLEKHTKKDGTLKKSGKKLVDKWMDSVKDFTEIAGYTVDL